MASVLIMSKQGSGVPLALRLAQEGHIVKMYIKDKNAKRCLQGYKNPSQVGAPKMLEQYDLILYDMVGMGELADKMTSDNRIVIGGGAFNDKLELDREYGEKVARSLMEIEVPESTLISDKAGLIKVLEEADKAMVIKPLGNKATRFTLVSEDKRNRPLLSLAKNIGGDLLPLLLQEKIDGIEVSTEGWFNGEDFVLFNHTLEHKRLMEGELGPMTGCMGNVVWDCEADKLVEQTLLPLVPLLEKVKYKGPIDVNCIVTEQAAHFLEFTARFGYDAIQAWTELIKGPFFNFLWSFATGETYFQIREDYGFAVRLSMPPYPLDDEEEFKDLNGVQLLNIPKGAEKHTFLMDVMLKDKVPVCAGVDGILGCVTARGSDIYEVRKRAYRTARNISIHGDIQYRKDIGAGVEKKIEKLKTWGWLDA